MKSFLIAMTVAATAVAFPALAQVVCPAPPQGVGNTVIIDAKAGVGKLGKVNVGELGAKVTVIENDLLGKYPNADKIAIARLVVNVRCEFLKNSKMTDREINDELKILTDRLIPQEKKSSAPILVPVLSKYYSIQLHSRGGNLYNLDMRVAAQLYVSVNSDNSAECGRQRAYSRVYRGSAGYGYNPYNRGLFPGDPIVAFHYDAGQTHENLEHLTGVLAKELKLPEKCVNASERTYLQLVYDTEEGANIVRHYQINSFNTRKPTLDSMTLTAPLLFKEAYGELEEIRRAKKQDSFKFVLDEIVRQLASS